ncbi:M56 family metallopeptidase [Paenibacillus sp. UNC499MF]|uniref:M56 family metallopeptidase n=1 Tax=Paenibacillus sp. UNC499MF TaxID=1502751 RepID=UPI00089FE05B|nr:M56 family metallopeptidase [Paenibacillus sp. UNC499MF]SEG57728.1 Signal transducer regulating beta-lactamase production, contains metallopeptidase domain [Paenibacillus sp. UNC499MF]
MTSLFLAVLNMSITASYVALAVMITRLLLKRAPKIFSYILWSAVAVRLLIPVSFTSSLSLLQPIQPQGKAGTGYLEFIPQDMAMHKNPMMDAGISGISHFINSAFPAAAPASSVDLMQTILWVGSIIWITGAFVLLFYSAFSYVKLRSRIRTATLVKGNIFETDRITTPFVCGFLKPRIYIPTGLSEHELPYILLHEETHIQRRDYWLKPLAFVILTVHWFNPLMWLSYSLMSKDMEMSCDESVVQKMGDRIKGSYSTTLLSLAVRGSGLKTGSPLAFGEGNIKARIKNILAYRQPSSRMAAVSVLVIAALVLGCSTNPKPLSQSSQLSSQPLYSGYDMDMLMGNKTLYVGNHIKVGGLIGGMPKPGGLEGRGIELQTKAQPYGLTIYYEMNDSTEVVKNEVIGGEAFYRNAVLLLSLIDNVDRITYSIADDMGRNDDSAYSFTLTREQADQRLGEDVRSYGKDQTSLRQLIDRLERLKFGETGSTV